MGVKRKPKTAFLMTDAERLVLAMYRSGKSIKDISTALGYSYRSGSGCVSGMLTAAAEKERLTTLDKRSPQGHTRLIVARGRKRMERK